MSVAVPVKLLVFVVACWFVDTVCLVHVSLLNIQGFLARNSLELFCSWWNCMHLLRGTPLRDDRTRACSGETGVRFYRYAFVADRIKHTNSCRYIVHVFLKLKLQAHYK